MELYDIKLEFGRIDDGQIALIDEISGAIEPIRMVNILNHYNWKN